jgi:hypothetical protein
MRVQLYIAAKKWDMAPAVASHLVKVEPENEVWWISLAYSVRRVEGVEKAEALRLSIHPKVAMIACNLACYASVKRAGNHVSRHPLLIPTRLSALGWVVGGAQAVIQALLQVLGPTTLARLASYSSRMISGSCS